MKLLVVMSVLFGLTNLFVPTSAFWFSRKLPKVTDKVIFDVEINGKKQGRIVIGLFGEIVPRTVEIFKELAKAKEGKGYKGSTFFDGAPWYLVKGGYISRDDGIEDGSVYRGLPNDENFILKHDGLGWVSVANSVSNRSNGTEFFITLTGAHWFDRSHVIFGRVLEGIYVVDELALRCEGFRTKRCVITDSAVVEVDKPFTPDA